ncbi:Tctex-1 [Martensiomyces pterosporus]|nr:Tctex-1 [Martensiomyces pterosporus]
MTASEHVAASGAARPYSEEEVYKYLKAAVDLAIGNGEYHHGLLPELHNNIVEYAAKKLAAIRPSSYKSIVTCTIVQNTGSGFHIGNALRWDESQDGLVTYKFQNKSMNAIVTAYLISA